MRWGSHPITSSTAIIWATRTPKNEQVARCGNAVCPPMAAAVARANFPEYVAKVGDTITTMAALLDMVAV